MGYNKLTCSFCKKPVEVGSQVCIKGKTPSDQKWRSIFFKGVIGINEYFQIICEKCKKDEERR